MGAKETDAEDTGAQSVTGLMDAVHLKPRHGRTQSDSDNSAASFDFDEERPSQDDDDIDNTPATSYGGFLSTRSDVSADAKSESSQLSNILPLNCGLSVASEDPGRMEELKHEVEALFDRFIPDFQAQQDDSGKADQQDEPTLLSRNLPAVLSEFEKQREHPLIDPKVYSQLEVFADENPDVPISSDLLVKLILELESSARSVLSDEVGLKTPPLMDRALSHSTGNDSTPTGVSDDMADLSQDEYLIRDGDSSRDSSRELSAEAAFILNLKEDLRIERDKNDALQQNLSDKERRVNTLEHKLTTSQEQYEELMLEEQAKLEELHKQIQSLRREDKDLRTKYFEVQEQNNAYELQLTALNTQVEGAEKASIKLRRDLDEESSQLIKAKADLDRRVKEAKELSEYLVECEQAKNAAEDAKHELQQELDKVKMEAVKLQGYKEETEELRSTVDTLEMELDEVRRLTTLHSKESSIQPSSNPGTMTRRLGNELARSMELDGHSSGEDTQVEDKDGDTSNVDDYVETVIQRRRRRVGKARKSVEMVTQSIQTDVPEVAAVETVAATARPDSFADTQCAQVNSTKPQNFLQSFSAVLRANVLSIMVMVLAVGLATGLMLNTSRDIYHIHRHTLDAEEFRKLNHLPTSTQNFYYDSRYPSAVVAGNFVDDRIGPIVDAMQSIIGLGNPSRPPADGIVY
ncbi:hypothetical protein PSEUBRA_004378 [Kalmanozyma brasiliensis GHG001]|uniref:Uncharacterized protein n=1 Tax=Kalmanozyma brasiliensis (strain GHG001) TaxID=1365824 RepID=V5GKI8_KALBG|nr:uncharacterized protein PSEUBRA_004378 [Kalmanozyma brasiliensis GHG001]EST06477.1 hypothetical protein PSEUBRA_004378 [Kalmanozyma brasiliensis GHG001]